MKRVLLLVFLGLVLESYSQLNHFLPDSNTYFSVSSYKFWFQGDTTIGHLRYKKVYQQSHDSIADYTKASYYAAVREDTLGEKIYCIQKDDGTERLIADFSLKINDTATISSFWPFGTPIEKKIEIDYIDTVTIEKMLRKRLVVKSDLPGYFDYWIEGIGSTSGLFFAFPFGIADLGIPELLCIYRNDTISYQNPEYDCCYRDYYVSIVDESIDVIKVYPSITYEYIQVEMELESQNKFYYDIFKTTGSIIREGRILTKTIDVSTLEKGIYLLNIYDKSKTVQTIKKFVKL